MKFTQNYSIKNLLAKVNYYGDFNGKGDSIVTGFCDDFFAKNGDLTWTDNSLVLKNLLAKECNLTIITNINVSERFENKTIVFFSNPLRLFETIIDAVYLSQKQKPVIGKNTIIHDTVIIGNNVTIGDYCKISPHVIIGDNVVIGDYVEIEAFTILGNTPYHVLRDRHKCFRDRKIYGSVYVENNVHIGSFCSIDNGITTETRIGRKCKLGNFVEIGHDVVIGNNCCFAAQTAIAGYVSIGNDCTFWGKSGVSNRIRIAAQTELLASSILTKSVFKSGLVLCGFPAIERTKYWRCKIHERRVSEI